MPAVTGAGPVSWGPFRETVVDQKPAERVVERLASGLIQGEHRHDCVKLPDGSCRWGGMKIWQVRPKWVRRFEECGFVKKYKVKVLLRGVAGGARPAAI